MCLFFLKKRSQVVPGVRNRNAEGFGLQNKGFELFWGVGLDKLEWFTISWTGVSVLGMLRSEPF